MKLDGIPKQNKKKKENTHSFDNAFQVLKLLLIKKYNIELPVLFFLIVLYQQVSTYIIFQKTFIFHQQLKNNICHIFSFFNGFTQTKHWGLHFWKNHSFKFGYEFCYVHNKKRFKYKEKATSSFYLVSWFA